MELQKLAREGKLRDLPGFGEKSEAEYFEGRGAVQEPLGLGAGAHQRCR